jgi:ribosome-associated toxin RatA of RatAB toxin-antitoxin module
LAKEVKWRFAPKNTNGIAVKFPAEFMPSVVSLLSKMCKGSWKSWTGDFFSDLFAKRTHQLENYPE